MIGRRPIAAFGNSTGDEQMLEYTGAGDGSYFTTTPSANTLTDQPRAFPTPKWAPSLRLFTTRRRRMAGS